jgi:MFS family permease
MPDTIPSAASAVRTAVAGMLALVVAMGIGRFAFTPLLPLMQHDAGLTLVAGSWLASANYLGYILGAITAAWLPGPPTRWIRIGLASTAVLTAAMGLTHDTPAWLALRALSGVASAWVLVCASTWALRRFADAGRPQLGGVLFTGVGAGVACTGVLAALGLAAGATSAMLWMAFGALAAVIAGGLWPAFVARPEPATAAGAGSHRATMRPAVIVLIVTYGVFGFGYIIPATFLPVIAREALGVAAIADWFWPAVGVTAAVSTLVANRLTVRYGNAAVLIASFLLEGIGVALLVPAPGVIAMAASALLLGGTFVVITLATLRAARELTGADSGGLIGILTAAFGIGQIAGPLAAGYVVHAHGSFVPVLVVAAASMIVSGGALAIALRSAGPHRPAI